MRTRWLEPTDVAALLSYPRVPYLEDVGYPLPRVFRNLGLELRTTNVQRLSTLGLRVQEHLRGFLRYQYHALAAEIRYTRVSPQRIVYIGELMEFILSVYPEAPDSLPPETVPPEWTLAYRPAEEFE